MSIVNRDPQPEHSHPVPQLGLRMRLWGWWTAWRLEQMARVAECKHNGSIPVCWACVLLSSHPR